MIKSITLWIGALVLMGSFSLQSRAQVAVIAHPSVPAEAVDAATLEAIYTLDEQTWSDGSRIVVFDQKNSSAIQDAFYGFLGRQQSDLKKVWLRLKLSGEGHPPDLLETDTDLVKHVADTPGAIGYVARSSVTDGVKVIATIN